MRKLCTQQDKEFTEYENQAVIWSGDTLPVCPHCGESPYAAQFDYRHVGINDGGNGEGYEREWVEVEHNEN